MKTSALFVLLLSSTWAADAPPAPLQPPPPIVPAVPSPAATAGTASVDTVALAGAPPAAVSLNLKTNGPSVYCADRFLVKPLAAVPTLAAVLHNSELDP
jgi:hypothetical protein